MKKPIMMETDIRQTLLLAKMSDMNEIVPHLVISRISRYLTQPDIGMGVSSSSLVQLG